MKSWLLLHMALCIASGQPWLGHSVSQAPVLYIDEEMSERALRRRLKQLAAGLGVTTDVPLQALSHAGIRMNEEGAGKLIAHLNALQFKPQVIIIETLRQVLVGKENEAHDVSSFWRNLDPLFVQGVSLIVAHHMRKPKLDGGDNIRYRASGTTALIGGCDNAIGLHRPEPHSLVLTQVKNRDIEEPAPLSIHVAGGRDNGPVTLTIGEKWIDNWGEEALALCAKHPDLSHLAIYAQYAEQIGVSYTTYWRRLSHLPCSHQAPGPASSASGGAPA